MPNNNKFYPKDSVLFITSSVEHGLPFIPNPIINAILNSVLARAQNLFSQEICHFTFMANHFHMILRVSDPLHVSDFIGYIKCKSATAINRLLGNKKHTIWEEGFDSPVVLDQSKVIEKIIYTYANPSKARLVDKIEQYPGLSSWNALTKGSEVRKVRFIKLKTILALPSVDLSYEEQVAYLQRLNNLNKEFHTLHITPNAWFQSFKHTQYVSVKDANTYITNAVRLFESRYKEETPAMGAAKLRKQPINQDYRKNKTGRKTVCIGSIIEKRINFISWFKETSEIARATFKKLRDKNTPLTLPPGFFAPGKILHANFFNFQRWVDA